MARPPRKKKDIERAALELFAETGIDGASIRMIAERAGVTEGALYRHHKSKDDLVRALFAEAYEQYAAMMDGVRAEHSTFAGRVRAMVEGFFRAYDADFYAFRFVLLVQHDVLDKVRVSERGPTDVIIESLKEAVAAGEVPKQDLVLASQFMLGIVMQTATAHRYGRIEGALARYADEVAAACLRAVRAA